MLDELPKKNTDKKQNFLVLLLFFANLLLFLNFLRLVMRGLDTTDEAFYFLEISNPWLQKGASTLYSYVYGIFFNMLGKSMSMLKAFNIVVLIALSYAASAFLIEKFSFFSSQSNRMERYIASLVIASTSLTAIFGDITIPTYNSLSLSGIFVTIVALLLLDSEKRIYFWCGWIFLGVGGWIVSMAKPTSALLLGLLCLMYLLFVHKKGVAKLFVSLVVFAVLCAVTMMYVSGGVFQHISDVYATYEKTQMLFGGEGGYDYTLWGSFLNIFFMAPFRQLLTQRFFVFFLLSFILVIVSFSVEKKIRWVEFFILLILILLGLFFGIGMQVPFFERAMVSSNPHYRFIYAIAIPLGALVAMLCKYKTPLMDGKKTALVFFLLTLPFVYTYGTGIPGGMVFPRLVVFWHMGLLALIMVFYREQIQFRNLFGVFCLLFAFTAAQINYGQWHPFRQKQSLVLQSKMICLPTTEKGLIVDDDVYAYVSTLQSIAFGAGFNVGEPLLDMTGNMPAAALFLGAATPGARRFYSNYPFSKSNTKNILSQVDNEILANAWLLIVDEPNEYEYDLAFLQQCDIFVDRDYEKVGSMLAPTYTHDMTPRRHFLFKPLKQNQDSEE